MSKKKIEKQIKEKLDKISKMKHKYYKAFSKKEKDEIKMNLKKKNRKEWKKLNNYKKRRLQIIYPSRKMKYKKISGFMLR